jgi:peptidoglycan/xylan/chitin deacetylase (PgdA/CDA1 family)
MVPLLALGLLLAGVDGGPAPAPPPDGGEPAREPPAQQAAPPAFAIRAVTTREPVVALTFDACATLRQPNGFDRRVFDILAAEQIPATIYLSGRWVDKHPKGAKAIAAASFIELGNHSYSHPRLTLVRKERLRWQIRSTNKLLEKRLGRRPLSLRPPAGAWDAKVIRAASAEHLPVVTWSVVSGDVGGHVRPSRMVQNVLDQVKPGAIIIFHINRREPYTKRALPDVIAGLREKGFRFVTVSQLLALPDATPEPAKPSHLGFHKRNKPPPTEPVSPEPTPPTTGDEHAHPPT